MDGIIRKMSLVRRMSEVCPMPTNDSRHEMSIVFGEVWTVEAMWRQIGDLEMIRKPK
jgi:hypothetical protein